MKVELLGLQQHREPGAVLELVDGEPSLGLGVADDRREPRDGAGHQQAAPGQEPREPVEPDLTALGRCCRHQDRKDAPCVADEVDVPAVFLDDRDDLRHDLVAGAHAVARLELGQLVELEQCEDTGATASGEALQLVLDLGRERRLREGAGGRIGLVVSAWHGRALEPDTKPRDELVRVRRPGDDVVGTSSERRQRERPMLERCEEDDRRLLASVLVADPVDELERPVGVERIGNVDHDELRQHRRELPQRFLHRADGRRHPASAVDDIAEVGASAGVGRDDEHDLEPALVVAERRRAEAQA